MGTISESVATLEKCKARLNDLCGEILATLSSEANQQHHIADLASYRDRWREKHAAIVGDLRAAERGEGV